MNRLVPLLALLAVTAAYGAVTFEDGVFSLYRSGRLQAPTYASHAECKTALESRAAAEPKTSGYLTWACRQNVIARYSADPVPTCGPKPDDLTQQAQCPAGTTGTYPQVKTHITAPHPQCWTESAWTPSTPPADKCLPPPAGSIVNLPVVCGSATITDGQAINACPWTSQSFQRATSSSWVRSAGVWRRFGGVTGTVEVCTVPKLQGDPVAGGNCSSGASTWDAMAYVAPAQVARAAPTGTATLSWVAPMTNMDGSELTDLAGYRIAYGTDPGVLHEVVQVPSPTVTTYTVSGLPPGVHYFTVRAYTPSAESAQSPIWGKLVQ